MATRGLRPPPPRDSVAAGFFGGNALSSLGMSPRIGRCGIVRTDLISRISWIARAQGVNSGVISREQEQQAQQERFNGTQFMFHTQGGGQVRAFVQERSSKYIVNVEATLPDILSGESPFLFHWGLFRSDSSDWVILEPENAPPNTNFLTESNEAMQTPMQQLSPLVQTIEIELPLDMAPFFVAFVLLKPGSESSKEIWIKSNSDSNFCVPLGLSIGRPDPLGVTLEADNSANFALYSKNATGVTLCLYKPDDVEPSMEIDLQSITNRTGDIWHVRVPVEGFVSYGYRCKGEETWDNGNRFHKRRILLDPYAKSLAPFVPGQDELPSPAPVLGLLPTKLTTFDWGDDSPPSIELERVAAYRLDVAGFTGNSSSGLDEETRGTFLGVIEKISYFKALGVNVIILRPIFAYDKTQGPEYPSSFFCPMDNFGSKKNGISASISFKEMVKALHKNGIELIMDVVYTQTSEKGDDDPETVSFRGIDNQTYYVLDKEKRILQSKSGSANIFNSNHPAVHKLIVDSLRYWIEEYHVDGFCFVNARDITKGPNGEDVSRPILVETITFDPLLANAKLIADYYPRLPEKFKFPHWKRWSEFNMNFQRDLSSFFRGDQGMLSDLATRICGSADMFADGRGPSFSFNFIKHSFEPLTTTDSESTEDSTSKTKTNRKIQIVNLLVALFLSQGTPVLTMGDEFGLSETDKPRFFDWGMLESNMDIVHLISSLLLLRSQHKNLLQKNRYMNPEMINWRGAKLQEEPAWSNVDSKFLAVTLTPSGDDETNQLCIAFNAEDDAVEMLLEKETSWLRVVDTSFPHPETISVIGTRLSSSTSYEVQPCSVVVLLGTKRNQDTKQQ